MSKHYLTVFALMFVVVGGQMPCEGNTPVRNLGIIGRVVAVQSDWIVVWIDERSYGDLNGDGDAEDRSLRAHPPSDG